MKWLVLLAIIAAARAGPVAWNDDYDDPCEKDERSYEQDENHRLPENKDKDKIEKCLKELVQEIQKCRPPPSEALYEDVIPVAASEALSEDGTPLHCLLKVGAKFAKCLSIASGGSDTGLIERNLLEDLETASAFLLGHDVDNENDDTQDDVSAEDRIDNIKLLKCAKKLAKGIKKCKPASDAENKKPDLKCLIAEGAKFIKCMGLGFTGLDSELIERQFRPSLKQRQGHEQNYQIGSLVQLFNRVRPHLVKLVHADQDTSSSDVTLIWEQALEETTEFIADYLPNAYPDCEFSEEDIERISVRNLSVIVSIIRAWEEHQDADFDGVMRKFRPPW